MALALAGSLALRERHGRSKDPGSLWLPLWFHRAGLMLLVVSLVATIVIPLGDRIPERQCCNRPRCIAGGGSKSREQQEVEERERQKKIEVIKQFEREVEESRRGGGFWSGAAGPAINLIRDVFTRGFDLVKTPPNLLKRMAEEFLTKVAGTAGEEGTKWLFEWLKSVVERSGREDGESGGKSVRIPTLRDVYFEFDSDKIAPLGLRSVEAAALEACSDGSVLLVVTGFADRLGTDRYNSDLATRRAGAVAVALEERGVPSYRMLVIAMGERGWPLCGLDGVRDPGQRRATIAAYWASGPN